MTEKEFFTETGSIVLSHDFRKLKAQVGLKSALFSVKEKTIYIVRLWILREIAIIKILYENYQKIPRLSWSHLIVGVYARFACVRKMTAFVERKVKNHLTYNI